MALEQLRSFAAVAEREYVTRAAEVLLRTQAAASASMLHSFIREKLASICVLDESFAVSSSPTNVVGNVNCAGLRKAYTNQCEAGQPV